MLARENWKEGTAEMLKEWLVDTNRDLRVRKGNMGSECVTEKKTSSAGASIVWKIPSRNDCT
jgi:hypothetical protein